MTFNSLKRNNFFDFKQVSSEDMAVEQGFNMGSVGLLANTVAGTGIVLDFPQERVVFDSEVMTSAQSALVATSTFDGRGILPAPYNCADQVGGNNIAIEVSGCRIDGFLKTSVVVIGKTFDDSLRYEFVEFNTNTTKITRNKFKQVVNVLFQNFRGNANTTVDGYGSFDVGGRVRVTESSPFRPSRACLAASQILEPDLRFANFKTSDSGRLLGVELSEAIGPANEIDDLDINTTVAVEREFAAAADTSLIYAQKFKFIGNNIQKVTLALRLEAGVNWSGNLEVAIRPLLSQVSCSTDFLPDADIEFDPAVVATESVTLSQSELEERGYRLTQDYQEVDFVFSTTKLGSPQFSGLTSGEYYALTVRRLGDTAVGTIVLPEARNSDPDMRFSIFSGGVWTDLPDKSMWFAVWSAAVTSANGAALDNGTYISEPKIIRTLRGTNEQGFVNNVPFINAGEGSENYYILQTENRFSDQISHPRTGDPIPSRIQSVGLLSAQNQDSVVSLINQDMKPILLCSAIDRNSKFNPEINGTLIYPAQAIFNRIDIINAGSDLLVQNVVNSIITPNILNPTVRYRVIRQETSLDLYGDIDGDGVISASDAARLLELDGYAPDLSSGTVLAADQLAAVLNGSISLLELVRADLNNDGVVTAADDGYELSQFLINGTQFSRIADGYGAGFNRVTLYLEPLFDQIQGLTPSAESTLEIHSEDSDLIDNIGFSEIDFSIEYIPVWDCDHLEINDLRRYVTRTYLDFSEADLSSSPESGGKNSVFLPGDLILAGEILDLASNSHPLDYEKTVVEFDIPDGDTVGELNVFTVFVVGQMSFSDGTIVALDAINNSQVRLSVSIGSFAKNLDGYDYEDSYVSIDEVIGTYLDHATGTLRFHCKNVKRSLVFPELRTRIAVVVELKKAGFANPVIQVNSSDLAQLLS